MHLSKNNGVTADDEKGKLAKQFVAALRSRNWEQFKSLLAADATWSLPGRSIISGEAQGASAIVKRAQTLVEYGVNFGLKNILIGQNGMVLSLHNTARRGELSLDEQVAIVFGLRDGKIAVIDTCLSDVESLNAFFIPV